MDGDRGSEAKGFRVVGRVQGVGFRWWTRRVAGELGLGGSVRNLPDGSVEVQARGETAAVERLQELLARGPGSAQVDRVEPIAADPSVPPDEFRIDV